MPSSSVPRRGLFGMALPTGFACLLPGQESKECPVLVSRVMGIFGIALPPGFAYLLPGQVSKESVAPVSLIVGLFGIALLT